MLSLVLTLFVITCVVFTTGEHIPSTKGMQKLSLTCDTKDKLEFLLPFQEDHDFDFLTITRLPHENVEVAVTKIKVDDFKKSLESQGIEYKIDIKDVENTLRKERAIGRIRRRRSPLNSTSTHFFNYFPRHEVINDYLKEVSKTNEDVSLIDIGSSYEGRKMYGVKISSDNKNETKPAILVDAGMHAREWISITTALLAIEELVKEKNKHLYKNVDWYIFPSMNPDGYEFSHTTYRYWRKTRSENFNSRCKGVDINRNYGYKWRVLEEEPDSNTNRLFYPCENIYAGNKEFSELETQNMRDFTLSRNGTIKLYADLHSTQQNGKYIIFPWSYTQNWISNYQELKELGNKAASAISALYGTNYFVASASQIYDLVPGTSMDWFLGAANSSMSYVIELPSLDFMVSEDKIETIGLEAFEALKVFQKYVDDNY